MGANASVLDNYNDKIKTMVSGKQKDNRKSRAHKKMTIAYSDNAAINGYVGDYNEETGEKEGHGIFIYENDDMYTGNWKNNKKHGYGEYKFANGDCYKGYFVEGMKDGEGKYTYDNGDVYTGQFKDGMKHGKVGKFDFSSGCSYRGEFAHGVMQGVGTFEYLSGARYVGQFHNNLKSGSGSYTFSKGSSYDGAFQDGMMHGSGSMRYKNGDVCKCEYENGEVVQLTEQIVQNDPMLGSAVSDVVLKGYAGNRNDDGRKEGYGRQLFSNGDIYEGNWKDNKKHGLGSYYYTNGDMFEGLFKCGVKSGHGNYLYASGSVCRGEFKDGKIVEGYKLQKEISDENDIKLVQEFKYKSDRIKTLPRVTKGKIPSRARANKVSRSPIDSDSNPSSPAFYRLATAVGAKQEFPRRITTPTTTISTAPLAIPDFANRSKIQLSANAKDHFYPNGDTYRGDLAGADGSTRHGVGNFHCAETGDDYLGEYDMDLRHGWGSQVYGTSSTVFEGEFQNDLRHGQGITKFADGTCYRGAYANDFMNGLGVYTFTAGAGGSGTYEGEFVDGEFHGRGKLTYLNGTIYEGSFVNGKREGFGLLVLPPPGNMSRCRPPSPGRSSRGGIYEGYLKDGLPHGRGKYEYADHSLYEGEFRFGIFHGNGVIQSSTTGDVYDGQFRDGSEHGLGRLVMSNGVTHEGDYRKGAMEGLGRVQFQSGDFFVGGFTGNGLPHGHGIHVKNGVCKEDVWQLGRKVQAGSTLLTSRGASTPAWVSDNGSFATEILD